MAYQAGQGFGRPEGDEAYGAGLLAMPGTGVSGGPTAPRQHSIAGILGAASPLDGSAKSGLLGDYAGPQVGFLSAFFRPGRFSAAVFLARD
ncbi:Hypp1653 [Branchiostoma lanceolatum]|uniref:Hypp1653 protein n=1 Tax=Branchiostoma lanceolatum TaxID=7740 RepID=A0A8K0EPN7_BRALA|nr:Hypp1653 [Branchiostoma lanceolatum]